MKKLTLAALMAPVILAGCASQTPQTSSGDDLAVSKENMMHHRWVLTHVDGSPVKLAEGFNAPDLEVGEHFTANGHGGCNRYFGEAELRNGQFRIEKMASTMMACPEPAMKLEDAMTKTLSNWSDVTLTRQGLELKGQEHILTFKLRDWVY
ncbi:META domain-containing protein [Parasalinivibrio latis]|uniref:META domain-containing protein n=1 Tax=Parasalinivibrio latis TaxID=2952610 RepID=UPI0030E3747C